MNKCYYKLEGDTVCMYFYPDEVEDDWIEFEPIIEERNGILE